MNNVINKEEFRIYCMDNFNTYTTIEQNWIAAEQAFLKKQEDQKCDNYNKFVTHQGDRMTPTEVKLTYKELNIIRNYLFKNGYDYLNKEISRCSKITHELANQYVKELKKNLDTLQKLELKFLTEELVASEGKK